MKTRQEVIDRFANSGWARTTSEHVIFVEGLIAAIVPGMIENAMKSRPIPAAKPEPAKPAEAPERVTLYCGETGLAEHLWPNPGDRPIEYIRADVAAVVEWDRKCLRERADKAEARLAELESDRDDLYWAGEAGKAEARVAELQEHAEVPAVFLRRFRNEFDLPVKT